MKKPWSESRFVIPAMVAIAVLLILFAPLKLGVIAIADIENKKDLIDAISKIVTCFVLIIGGILSYIKFFKGRVLKPKVDLQFHTTCYSSDNQNIHSIEVLIINKGNVAVWNYILEIYAIPYPKAERPIELTSYILNSNVDEIEHLVDVGETAFEHAVIELDKEPVTYTFEAILTDDRGTKWRRCITVKNAEQQL